ncbi:hypothetical protein WAG23_03785 [Bacillus cereus]
MVRIRIVKRMGYGKAEINNGRVNKGIQLIAIFVGAVVIDIASYLLLRKDKNKRVAFAKEEFETWKKENNDKESECK